MAYLKCSSQKGSKVVNDKIFTRKERQVYSILKCHVSETKKAIKQA